MDRHLFLGAFFFLPPPEIVLFVPYVDFTLVGGFIFRFQRCHKAEFVELHRLQIVENLLYGGEGVSLSALTAIPLASAHQSGVEVREVLTLFGRKTFGLFVVDALSHVVDSFEPYLEVVKTTVAVLVAVDGYSDFRICHVALELIAFGQGHSY